MGVEGRLLLTSLAASTISFRNVTVIDCKGCSCPQEWAVEQVRVALLASRRVGECASRLSGAH